MIGIPKWVSEGSVRKYHRAMINLRSFNDARKIRGEEEVDVKGLYEIYQGLVIEESVDEIEEEVESPKKKSKKA